MNLQEIAEISRNIKVSRKVAIEARKDVRDLSSAKENASFKVIRELIEDFLSDMQSEWKREGYITGRYKYSSDFTKFVNRQFSRSWSGHRVILSNAHRDAQDAYNAALINLNRVFVEELERSSEIEELDEIAKSWGLKNLTKVEH